VLLVAQEQQVDVDRTRAVADVALAAGQRAAELGLDGLARVEQRLRAEVGLDPDAGVQEVGLVEDLADRVGVVGRRRRGDRHAVARERVDGGLQGGSPVADVRAETEVAGAHEEPVTPPARARR
jgi:hypothetical protein